jgi:hypothetical protein
MASVMDALMGALGQLDTLTTSRSPAVTLLPRVTPRLVPLELALAAFWTREGEVSG